MNAANAQAALQILQQTFGHESFRGQQLPIIDTVLEGGNALVIMPTGMGKSLCYQVPALVHRAAATDPSALTLVISPLIALMKDQVDSLRAKGVSASFINSSLTRSEREKRYDDLGNREYDLLYVTPERFRKEEFVQQLAKRNIRLLAVDEAHCISEWGHDFRPDYTRIQEFRALVGNPPTVALTATATPEVQHDIVRQLGLNGDEIQLFHEGIDRPNLDLEVIDVWGEDEKLAAIVKAFEFIAEHGGSGIVYFTFSRRWSSSAIGCVNSVTVTWFITATSIEPVAVSCRLPS